MFNKSERGSRRTRTWRAGLQPGEVLKEGTKGNTRGKSLVWEACELCNQVYLKCKHGKGLMQLSDSDSPQSLALSFLLHSTGHDITERLPEAIVPSLGRWRQDMCYG